MNLVHYITVSILIITVIFLIRAEIRKTRKQIYILKPLATALILFLVIYAWCAGLNVSAFYSLWILVALVFSLGGDIALMFQERPREFRLGLVLFLMANLIYAVTFSSFGDWNTAPWYVLIIIGFLAASAYVYLYPGLGSMRGSVLVYIFVISYMLNRAIATNFGEFFNRGQACLISGGAGLFYISDLILAVHRFRRSFSYNRISLAFYYAGQLMIACSTISL